MKHVAIACALLAIGASAPLDPGGVVAGAVGTLESQRHGVIAFDQRYTFDEHGPGHNTTREVDDVRLTRDGKLVALRLVRELNNGTPVTADVLAKDQATADAHLPTEDYRLPIGHELLAEYRFSTGTCSPCSDGQVAIAFTSLRRDDEHGDGTMIVDRAPPRIATLTFAPSAMPKHVDKATIVVRFGQVLPDLWDIVESRQRYDGHMLFIHGWAQAVRTYTNYRRYATVEDGRRALRTSLL